jgi:hypothetical protein
MKDKYSRRTPYILIGIRVILAGMLYLWLFPGLYKLVYNYGASNSIPFSEGSFEYNNSLQLYR